MASGCHSQRFADYFIYFIIVEKYSIGIILEVNPDDLTSKTAKELGNMPTRKINIGKFAIGGDSPLLLIAGPCVIESERHACLMAEALLKIAEKQSVPFVFKSSYDKANRSSATGYRGPGLDQGLKILARIKKEFNIPVISDIHSIEEIAPAAEVHDILQIPAFLCRQTEFIRRAGHAGKPVNVKKGQFMAPWDMKNVIAKIEETGNRDIILTERGVSFGYNNLVADFRALPIMRGFNVPVVFDATHSVQLPGGQGSCSGGDRDMALILAKAAAAVGIDGIFLETHDDPDNALCDGPNMIRLDSLPELIETLLYIDKVNRKPSI